jgi:hypothetical protein
MQRRIIVLALASLVALSAFGADETSTASTDKDKLISQLERTREKFLKSVDGLSEAQWNYKAAPEKWSIAQCAEHIAAAESFIRGFIEKGVAEPLPEGTDRAALAKDEMILTMITDRSKKFTAPEPLAPSNRFGSPADAVAAFKKEREATLQLAKSDADLRAHAVSHPAFGTMDTYSWMIFLSGHSERHTLQIEEVKANADYPKN